MLIVSRFVQGAAAGLMVTQILAILHMVFPASERGKAVALINVPVGITALIAGALVISESRAAQRPKLDLLGMPLAIAAVVLLVYPLTEGRHLGWPTWTYAMVAGALVVLVVFVAYEKRRFAKVGSALV